MQLQTNTQKKGNAWKDEAGVTVPFNRVTKLEQVKETHAGSLLSNALKINGQLHSLFTAISKANDDVCSAIDEENKAAGKKLRATKGNFTWYNFDKSIKIEVAINETIKFDEALIAAARELLDKFITKNVQGTDDIVRQLINSAFANTRGGLDSKKVMSLLKYRSKIADKQFQQALDHIEASISRPSSKRYYRIWAKSENGEYKNIDLNFSSI